MTSRRLTRLLIAPVLLVTARDSGDDESGGSASTDTTEPPSEETAAPATALAAEAAAAARGEFAKIPVEIGYYDRNFFTNALVFFLLGFLAIAFSWMAPTNRWVPLGSRVATILGAVYVIWGVTVRCLLLGRPPVATLYETILFITAIAVVVCLIAERMTKERMALGVGAALGAAGMFLASRYEVLEAGTQGDTMGGLVAVLNTNCWLATHVTTVTMGYAAGLLAAALGHVWLSMRLYTAFANKGPDMAPEKREWFRRFGRILYGVLCFGLLFSVIGMIQSGQIDICGMSLFLGLAACFVWCVISLKHALAATSAAPAAFTPMHQHPAPGSAPGQASGRSPDDDPWENSL